MATGIDSKILDIPIGHLQPTQEYIFAPKKANNPDPIEVLEIEGSFLIIDGHCRTSDAYAKGKSTIGAVVHPPSYYDDAVIYGVESSAEFLSKAQLCAQRAQAHIYDLPHKTPPIPL